MLTVIVLLVIAIVAYAQMREGLFTACCAVINVVLSGLVAFMFFEPCAEWLEPKLRNTFFGESEDFICLIVLFTASCVVLRLVVTLLARDMIAFNNNVQYGGGVVGAIAGYLLAGFLVCALETLPLEENFMGFTPRTGFDGIRSVFPPDRVWLALMRHAGAHAFAGEVENDNAATNYDRYRTFDRDASFEIRYLRYRRFTDTRGPFIYRNEYEKELGR